MTNPFRRSDQVFSIRRRLLGLSLLAVLGGYGMLIVATALIASHERRSLHRATAASLRQLLLAQRPFPGRVDHLSDNLARLVSPTMLAWVEMPQGRPPTRGRHRPLLPPQAAAVLPSLPAPSAVPDQVAVVRAGGGTYLTSSLPIQLNDRSVQLRFLEDVTRRLEQDRLVLLLLVLAAAIATLFTGVLLRPALDRGLAPLDDLGERMRSISTDTLESQRVGYEGQPQELVPIAIAFNDLLDRLHASWERQRGFVNGVSHELRTPISLILGHAGSLRRRAGTMTAQQAEQVDLIEAEAGRMGRLVADLLDLSRIEADRTLMPFTPFDAAEAIARVADRLAGRCRGRLQICEGAILSPSTFALGDAERFEQCLSNLIENALKYSAGTSAIRLRLDASRDRVVVHVIDAGPGVPDGEKDLIFNRFRRGRHAAGVPGSGVGLAVVRGLMEAMGGSVSVVDAPGGGADFQLRLKGAAPPRAA